MPVTRTAKRALVRSERKYVVNLKRRRAFRDTIKTYKSAPSATAFQKAISMLDKAAKWNLIHKNTASRMKAQLSKLLA